MSSGDLVLASAREAWRELLAKLEASKEETSRALGEEKAFHILNVHLGVLLKMEEAIKAAYGPEERASSLLYTQMPSILAELTWAQLAFLSTHYPSAFRCLRSALELACRARLVDLACPAEPLEKKLLRAYLLERKWKKLPRGWRLVKKAFESLSGFELERDERLRLRKAWEIMSRHAHASLAAREGQETVWHPWAFNKQLALSVLQASDIVSDAILVLLLDAFPRAHEQAMAFLSVKSWEEHLPMSYSYLRSHARLTA